MPAGAEVAGDVVVHDVGRRERGPLGGALFGGEPGDAEGFHVKPGPVGPRPVVGVAACRGIDDAGAAGGQFLGRQTPCQMTNSDIRNEHADTRSACCPKLLEFSGSSPEPGQVDDRDLRDGLLRASVAGQSVPLSAVDGVRSKANFTHGDFAHQRSR